MCIFVIKHQSGCFPQILWKIAISWRCVGGKNIEISFAALQQINGEPFISSDFSTVGLDICNHATVPATISERNRNAKVK